MQWNASSQSLILLFHKETNQTNLSRNYMSVQTFLGFFLGVSAARIASSNTVLSPSCVRAEHSKYFTAPISFALSSAWSGETMLIPLDPSFCSIPWSSRRSDFVPTKIIGVPGQWCWISGYHFDFTLSNDDGEIMEKAIRKTSVCGYDNGLRRS